MLLVKLDVSAVQVGGRMWWRRWGATEDVFWEFTLVDGRFSDSLQTGACEERFADFEEGRFSYYGEDMTVVWLEGAEAESVRAATFER